jgi:serine/threonine-protein phosphatase 2A catalytic subunit
LAKEVFANEPNVLSIKSPISVCGDIIGQFDDLLELFRVGGKVPDTNYLFLGNYVNKGKYSIYVISLLLCLKVRWPRRIYLLRGHQEARMMTIRFGMCEECIKLYGNDNDIWKYLTDTFDFFPLAAVIDNQVYKYRVFNKIKYFSVHGGLSPSLNTVNDIQMLNRIQVQPDGIVDDLLWSDPHDKTGWKISTRFNGYFFGKDATKKFLDNNKLKLIIRGHQLCLDGYGFNHDGLICTLYSAPNHLGRCGTKGGIMQIDEDSSYTL